MPHPPLRRRAWLGGALAAAAPLAPAWTAGPAGGRTPLQFPRDFGSHPAVQTEWWYVTGDVRATGGGAQRRYGFQLTFFRSRVARTATLRSVFAAHQLVFAHAAVSDVGARRLHHAQRIAREGFGIAYAREGDTAARIGAWQLSRDAADGAYRLATAADPALDGNEGLALALVASPTQPPLLQGDAGWSRKGPAQHQAGWYYSLPHLAVQGTLAVGGGAPVAVAGRAWLDHEWSDALLAPGAVGWDWVGMQLDDGAALTAFRMRRGDGSALWAGGSWRAAGGADARPFAAGDVRFTPLAHWTSPATGARYPVAWQLDTPAGRHTVRALFDAQELDSRASVGAVYWEGLCTLHDAAGAAVGSGYLEMTGYADPLRL